MIMSMTDRRALRLRCAATVFLVVLATTGSPMTERGTKVFYFHMFAQTATPVNIEESFDLTSVVRGIVPKILKAMAVEELPSTGFEPLMVRLKLVPFKGEAVMMDLSGNVVGLGKPHRLSLQSRKELRKLIFSAFPDG